MYTAHIQTEHGEALQCKFVIDIAIHGD